MQHREAGRWIFMTEWERKILIDLEGRMRNDINLIIVSGGT